MTTETGCRDNDLPAKINNKKSVEKGTQPIFYVAFTSDIHVFHFILLIL